MRKRPFVKAEWDAFVEAVLVDFYFDTAPEGHREKYMGFGLQEAEHLVKVLQRAIKKAKQEQNTKRSRGAW